MRFFKIMMFDLKNGIWKNRMLVFCPVLIAAVMAAELAERMNRLVVNGVLETRVVTWGEYWFYLYGGMEKYVPSTGNPFLFPVIWIILFVTVPFLMLNYPLTDMQGTGQHILVQAGGRVKWWCSKCCWNILGTVLYHTIIALVLMLFSLLFNGALNREIHMDVIRSIFNLERGLELVDRTSIPFSIVVLPILISVAVNMVQMVLCLFLKPVFSFLIINISMISSVYLLSPYMVGNYAMILRYDWIYKEGVSYRRGILFFLTLTILSAVIGMIRFRHYDILDRD